MSGVDDRDWNSGCCVILERRVEGMFGPQVAPSTFAEGQHVFLCKPHPLNDGAAIATLQR